MPDPEGKGKLMAVLTFLTILFLSSFCSCEKSNAKFFLGEDPLSPRKIRHNHSRLGKFVPP